MQLSQFNKAIVPTPLCGTGLPKRQPELSIPGASIAKLEKIMRPATAAHRRIGPAPRLQGSGCRTFTMFSTEKYIIIDVRQSIKIRKRCIYGI
jgi:hypothetical protein